jgi:hypothetical protein
MFADDPTSRPWLMQGQVYDSVSMPLYGGMAIEELVPVPGSANGNGLGPILNLSSNAATITGFTVFNQGHNMLMAPGNLVPQSAGGMSIMFFRMGTNARIWVGIDAAGIAAVEGNPINTTVYWDHTNHILSGTGTNDAIVCKVLAINTNCKTIVVANGLANWSTGNCALIQI